MGDAARDAVAVAVFFVTAGAGAWLGAGVEVDGALGAAVFTGDDADLVAVAGVFVAAAIFLGAGAGADVEAAVRAADAFLAGALLAVAFFAGEGLDGVFVAAAFFAGAFFVGAFFAATFFTACAAFFATAFLTTFFATTFFAAAFFAGAAFLAALTAFFAVFLAATGGVSFYSLVTGKRAVIPCRATRSNRAEWHSLEHHATRNTTGIAVFRGLSTRCAATWASSGTPALTRGTAPAAATVHTGR